jgi:hypothetical protein
MTPASKALLNEIICNATYESPDGGMNEALMNFTKQELGNLTDLKKKGFISTCKEGAGAYWVILLEPSRPYYEAYYTS